MQRYLARRAPYITLSTSCVHYGVFVLFNNNSTVPARRATSGVEGVLGGPAGRKGHRPGAVAEECAGKIEDPGARGGLVSAGTRSPARVHTPPAVVVAVHDDEMSSATCHGRYERALTTSYIVINAQAPATCYRVLYNIAERAR